MNGQFGDHDKNSCYDEKIIDARISIDGPNACMYFKMPNGQWLTNGKQNNNICGANSSIVVVMAKALLTKPFPLQFYITFLPETSSLDVIISSIDVIDTFQNRNLQLPSRIFY